MGLTRVSSISVLNLPNVAFVSMETSQYIDQLKRNSNDPEDVGQIWRAPFGPRVFMRMRVVLSRNGALHSHLKGTTRGILSKPVLGLSLKQSLFGGLKGN